MDMVFTIEYDAKCGAFYYTDPFDVMTEMTDADVVAAFGDNPCMMECVERAYDNPWCVQEYVVRELAVA